MYILYKSFYQIDNERQSVNSRITNIEFDGYISSLIAFVANNQSTRMYKIISMTTEIVNIICAVLSDIVTTRANNEIVENNFRSIANRLLRTEIETQELIDVHNLDRIIRKGNLLIAVLYNQDNNYTFMLSKVNNSEFIDEDDLIKKLGFSSETQKIWKTAVFECSVIEDSSIIINEIKVYLDKKVVYWCTSFLEVDEMLTDEVNTYETYKGIESILKRKVKPSSPNDYIQLSNSVIGYMRQERLIDYSTMITDIFDNYVPTELSEQDYNKVKISLDELPQKGKFDSQFTSVPSQIKSRIKKIYPVIDGIELKINDYVEDIQDSIVAFQADNGERFLKVKTTKEETFRAFLK